MATTTTQMHPFTKRLPSTEELERLLDYNPDTGSLRWKMTGRRRKAGVEAGSLFNNGYRVVMIASRRFMAHRIAWKIAHGSEPDRNIDHINGDRSDNRIANLRLATHSENLQNIRAHKDSKSGVKGVHFSSHYQKWVAQVNHKTLGYFNSQEEAALIAKSAREKMHGEFCNHGN